MLLSDASDVGMPHPLLVIPSFSQTAAANSSAAAATASSQCYHCKGYSNSQQQGKDIPLIEETIISVTIV